MSPHPSDEALEALVLGQHAGERAASDAEHVERCERCAESVARIAEARARTRRGGQERHLVPESAKKASRRYRPYIVASVAAGVLVGALVAHRMQREPAIIDLTSAAATRAVRTPLVRLFANTAEGPIELGASQTLKEASGLRLYAEIPPLLSLHVVTLDAGGVATVVEPALERPSGSTESGQRGFLAARVPVLRDLRIFAIFSKTALDPAVLRRAAERAFLEGGRRLDATRDLRLVSEHTHTSVVQLRPEAPR